MSRALRRLLVAAFLVTALAACGDEQGNAPLADASPPSSPASSSSGTLTPDATTPGGTPQAAAETTLDGDAPAGADPAPEVSGEPAPDFTLALGSGGEFHLAAETRPVYLVFWAEW